MGRNNKSLKIKILKITSILKVFRKVNQLTFIEGIIDRDIRDIRWSDDGRKRDGWGVETGEGL